MKKILCLLLCTMILMTSFVSCGNSKSGAEETTRRKVTAEDAAPETTEATTEAEKVINPDDFAVYKVFPAPEGDYRQIVIDYFLKESQIEWTPAQSFHLKWKSQGDYEVSIKYNEGVTYHGPIYSNGNADFHEFSRFLNDGKLNQPASISSAPDGSVMYFEEALGSQCVSSIVMALQQLVDFPTAGGLKPNEKRKDLLEFVGDLKTPDKSSYISEDVWAVNSMDAVYDSYSKMQKGDILYRNIDGSGHARIVDSVEIKKNAQGQPILRNSTIKTLEQTNTLESSVNSNFVSQNGYDTTWWIGHTYTFEDLYKSLYLPVTCKIYSSGEKLKDAYIALDKETSPENISRELKGVVSSNFTINYIYATIKDTNGNVVSDELDYRQSYVDTYSVNLRKLHYDLIEKANLKEGQTYKFTLEAGISRGIAELESFEFTYKK